MFDIYVWLWYNKYIDAFERTKQIWQSSMKKIMK